MYPVLKLMHMLNFLDTFSMGITPNLKEDLLRFHELAHKNHILYH